jgi:3-mercaptopyruvate sulfurtransferase SseA
MKVIIKRLAVSAVLALAAGVLVVAQHAAERIEFAEFQKLYAEKKVLVVDVRDEGSFAGGHIPGAINIPLGTEDRRIEPLKTEKRLIVTYCA